MSQTKQQPILWQYQQWQQDQINEAMSGMRCESERHRRKTADPGSPRRESLKANRKHSHVSALDGCNLHRCLLCSSPHIPSFLPQRAQGGIRCSLLPVAVAPFRVVHVTYHNRTTITYHPITMANRSAFLESLPPTIGQRQLAALLCHPPKITSVYQPSAAAALSGTMGSLAHHMHRACT